jgi:superfamily II DNA or RNA helicase
MKKIMNREIPEGSYLSKNGYVIKKSSISEDELLFLKTELRARPLQDEKYGKSYNQDQTYPIYTETKNKIYIPKMYGMKRYGDPKRYLPNYRGEIWKTNLEFDGTLYDNQIEPVNALLSACHNVGGGILNCSTGLGKCHKIDTEILMFSGKIKLVQDIVVGDLLMGDDSTPRKVLSLARGKDIMYDIIPTKGEKYTVNQEHILCLRVSSNPNISKSNINKSWQVRWFENFSFKCRRFKINDKLGAIEFMKTIKQQKIVEIAVKDYVKLPKSIKHILKGYKIAIDFDEKPLNFDPYIIGLWLGDGTSTCSQITNQDSIILHYLKSQLPKFSCYLQFDNGYIYNINGDGSGKYNSNNFLNELKIQNLIGDKHIPDIYKYNSRENRLKLLAGLLDSDGSLVDDKCTFDFSQKSEKLIDDTIYLARSLGFACYKSKQVKGCWYKNAYKQNYYYRICISGNTSEIPTLCPRKRANQTRQIKNVLNTGIKVKQLDIDDYYGFEIDGNHRYVLGDFTVTHNTFMTINVISKLKIKTIVIVNKISLMHQWHSELKRFIPGIEVGFIQGQKNIDVEDKHVVIAMLQSLARVDYPDSLFNDIGLTVIDEIQNTPSRGFSKVLGKLSSQYTIGLSATPKRSDGCEYVFQYHIGDIIYQSKVKRKGLKPILNTITINSSEYKEIMSQNKNTGQSQIQFTSMLTDLIQMPKRNRLILEIIKDLVLRESRKILVLSDRREHLKSLKLLLDNDLHSNFTYGLFLGQMKQSDLERSRASQVILATFSAFGEGVSEKDLDTLILTTPKKFIGHLKKSTKNENGKLEQIVGRIFRKDHTEKHPMIIDLHDNFSVYKIQSNQRRTFYKSHFTTSILENNKIDLDDYDIKDINTTCIQRTKKTEIRKDEQNDEQNSINLNQCIIED